MPEHENQNGLQPPETSESIAQAGAGQGPEKKRYKLPKALRMPAGGPYQRLFQVRQVVSNDLISLHVMANGLARHRLGLAVAKKMFRKAVARNRVKRLIREAFRLERPGFEGGGLDIVVRPKVKKLSLDQLRESLKRLVPKAQKRFLPVQPLPESEVNPQHVNAPSASPPE